jgi:hypothetical protein
MKEDTDGFYVRDLPDDQRAVTEPKEWPTWTDLLGRRHISGECQVTKGGAPECPACLAGDLEARHLPDEDRLR